MQKTFKRTISILLSILMVVSVFAIVPLSASAAYGYSNLARGTLIQPGDSFYFENIGSFKFADYNDPTIIHEVKGSDFSYNQATLSVTDGYYSFGSTKLLPTSVSPGGLLIADYDSTTHMATFGVQNITHSFDETTGTLTIGGSGVVPRCFAFTGSDVYGVVFTQSNLVKHLIIDATDMIAIKQDAFMAYTGGCVLEDVEINSTSSTPLIIENQAIFYEKDSAVTITVNAAKLATVTSCPVGNYSSPVNLIYNVEQPITFNKNALTEPSSDLTVTFPTGCKIFIPGGPQFTDSQLQEEYDSLAEYGDDEFFWRHHSDLVEGTDYVLGDARYEELTPLNASLVVGNDNTALFSAYTITDESVNGTVTASVNGTDVTEAAADADVLLTVAPDNGYQFKSISATYPKNKVEEFSDLVALMGDAVFSAADYADHPEYTCKVNDGKFVVYDGDTSVAELSEANMTNAELGGTYFSAQCGGLEWNLYFRDGRITDIYVYDSDYNYIFSSADGSKSTGTLLPTVVNLTTVTEGSQYSLTMPKMPVTVKAEFEAIPTYTVTWKNGDTVLETDTDVAEGTTPTYDGETPYKADCADCIYTFSGWTPEVTAVTGDATYTATFTESEKPETIKDCNNKYGNFRLYSNVPIVSFSNVNDLLTGAIIPITYGDSNTMIPVQDAKGYSYKFYDQTGTEIPAQIANSSSAPGSDYEFSDDVTVYTNVINFTRPAGCTAIYIVATEPAPAPALLILNVGENGKVVMDNGTFGNATDANNTTDIAGPINVADGTNASIVDGHTCNLVEGGSINIATGGRVSFYVSADNTGKITAIPDEGYICTGWYNGDTLYSSDAALSYQSISEDITLTAKFTPVTYTVTWKNWDGTELASEQVSYGATPIYDDQDPVKPDDELYKYTFTGWAPDVTAVTGDAEYTAQFDREDRGEIIDGKYYVDGVLKKSLGLIYLDGEYYYVMVTGEIYKNNSLSLAESKANGYIPQGRYYFDNEGKISYKNGIVAGYYYVNDELQKGAGLVKIGNDFYFVKQNGAVYKDASLYVAEAKTNGLMPAGKYFFDENGKMEVKNGVYGGFYYENNEIVKGKGIVEFENNLYFVKQNGAVYTTHHLMVPEAKTNGLIEPGLYDFEDDGRLIR